MKLQDLLKDIELGKVYTDKDRKPFKVNEEILNEFNKAHFLNLIKQELESKKGQLAYANDKIRYRMTPNWERKEFLSLAKEYKKDIKELQIRIKKVSKMEEGKLKEEIEPKGGMAKIAAIVKNKQHGKVGGKTVDMQSANLLMKLYNAVKDKDKEKMNKMNEKKLVMVLHKLWSRINLKLPV